MAVLTSASATGWSIPATVFDVRKSVEEAVAKTLPLGKTRALVGIGRMEGTQFIGELAWVQRINNDWTITAGLKAGTQRPVSGQVMIAWSK